MKKTYKVKPITGSDYVDGFITKEKQALATEHRIIEDRQKITAFDSRKNAEGGGLASQTGISHKKMQTLQQPSRYLVDKFSRGLRAIKMTFRIDKETKDILGGVAKKTGVSMAGLIRRAIWCYLSVRSQYVK